VHRLLFYVERELQIGNEAREPSSRRQNQILGDVFPGGGTHNDLSVGTRSPTNDGGAPSERDAALMGEPAVSANRSLGKEDSSTRVPEHSIPSAELES